MSVRHVRYALGALALSGCGLISSKVTTYDLDLPVQTFSVDAAGWQVTQADVTSYLQRSCEQSPTLCATAATSACPLNCTGTCDATAHTCDLGLQIAVHQTVDLVMEKPALKSVDEGTTYLTVTVDSLTYEVTANSLDRDTPVLDVYVAPMSVMDPGDPMAHLIGTIGVVTKQTTQTPTAMTFADGGQDELTATLSDFKSPFNVIVGGTLSIANGQHVPTGKLDANVHITAHASP